MNVSTATASMLTGKATKTLYRWVDSGETLAVQNDVGVGSAGGRLYFPVDEIAKHIAIPVTSTMEAELERVEAGIADGYNEVALMFFEAGVYEIAFKWFEMAAKKGHVDAMDWLATCYLEGLGTEVSNAHGIEWLGRAAAAGHPISIAKIESMNR